MTRDQDFEHRLADWLADGPSVAPAEVVDRAVEHSARNPQRHPAWVRARSSLQGAHRGLGYDRRWGRLAVVAATMALIISTALLATLPLAGGPGPAPVMDRTEVRNIAGASEVIDESEGDGVVERALRVEVADPRIDGRARQVLRVEDVPTAGLQRSVGAMRLENAWGAWEGVVNGVRYPDGTEIEYGWLAGEGAFAGFSYFHSTRAHPAEAERVLEGAIWPGEPPPMPDPSLLQADPLS